MCHLRHAQRIRIGLLHRFERLFRRFVCVHDSHLPVQYGIEIREALVQKRLRRCLRRQDADLPVLFIHRVALLLLHAIDILQNLLAVHLRHVEDLQRQLLLLVRQNVRRRDGRLDRFRDVLRVINQDGGLSRMRLGQHADAGSQNSHSQADNRHPLFDLHDPLPFLLPLLVTIGKQPPIRCIHGSDISDRFAVHRHAPVIDHGLTACIIAGNGIRDGVFPPRGKTIQECP